MTPRSDLFVPGVPEDVQNQRAISQMDQSKIDATALVLKKLDGYPKEHGRGALVESTVPDARRTASSSPGTLIVAIDGKPVGACGERLEGHRGREARPAAGLPGQRRRHDRARSVHAPALCAERPAAPRRGKPDEPVPVRGLDRERQGRRAVRRPDVGAGALRADDARRPDAGPDDRAAPGRSIRAPARSGPIGGISDKVVAAERAGATVFLVPADNMAELEGATPGTCS